MITFVVFFVVTVLIVKNDYLLRRGHVILEAIFKGAGHVYMIINYLLFIPSLMIFAEVERCDHVSLSPYHFTCLEGPHFSIIIFVAFSALLALTTVVYGNLFINAQFPDPDIPFACWDSKARVVLSVWKVVYIFHYDLLDVRYRMALRIGAFAILVYKLVIQLELPRMYNKLLHWFDTLVSSVVMTLHVFIILEDMLDEQVYFELLPVIALVAVSLAGILITQESYKLRELIARDNRVHQLFKNEMDMHLYINLLLYELVKLKSLDKGVSHSSTPQIFTIISRHMEHCRNEDCICKKYEPEYDKKFSSIGSRRLTMRQSTSFSSIDYMFKKKIPIKISYEAKCGIFMAEISDCIDRFLEDNKNSVGLKLQKSFFNHAYMNSSYKALFVQLENSHACSSFRGRINIYHVKTQIQEQMTQSEASPFSMDITTCLKFENQRVLFEQKIIDLCMVCESFWNALIQAENDYKVDKIHALLLETATTIIRIKQIFN